ncbi:13425_t:CDS:1, partial [Cetraspora pellucida]
NHDEDDTDELFNEIEYESEKLEEIKSFASDNILTDDEGPEELENKVVKIESLAVYLVVMKKIPTEKKAHTNENPTVEEQLNKIEKNGNLGEYQKSVKELFKKNKELFVNGLEELGCTELVKHVIKTQDTEPIKQSLYQLAPNEQEFVQEELKKLKEKRLIKESFSPCASPIVL